MGDYFQHWLDMGAKLGSKAPKIFYVNWFRKDENGKFMWPGFGENSRVLKWIVDRVDGKAHYVQTPMGLLPDPDDLDLLGLNITPVCGGLQ
jgi:phosphoenolpyruvate carboxykinase (GTP)